jgi:hypothetical protein
MKIRDQLSRKMTKQVQLQLLRIPIKFNTVNIKKVKNDEKSNAGDETPSNFNIEGR